MRVLVVLAAVAAVALSAVAAHAGWRVDLATQVADLAWGPPPCPVTVRWEPIPAAAKANWLTCTITFSTGESWQDFGRFCTAMLHERGHIQRQDGWHSPDPKNVMYPRLTRDPRCTLH